MSFKLNEKIWENEEFGKNIPVVIVKEFIKLLKENLNCKLDEKQLRFIDKLSGDLK